MVGELRDQISERERAELFSQQLTDKGFNAFIEQTRLETGEAPECEVWPTFYGEALILGYRDEIWDRLDYAAAVGCRNLVLNSNGTLLERWNNYDRLLASPLRRFILSLDGFTAPTFEAIRVGANRDAVYAQVEELLRRKAARGQRYPAIICQFSRMPQNADPLTPGQIQIIARWIQRGAPND